MTHPREADIRSPRRGRRILRWVLLPLGVLVTALVLVVVAAVVWVQATMFRGDDTAAGPLVLTGATVLAGPELDARDGWTVVVEDGRVTELGLASDVAIPPEADVLELDGHTVLPGLVDSHVHLGFPAEGGLGIVGAVADWFRFAGPRREAMLEHGVTTMRSLGDDPEWITDLRGRVQSDELAGPRVFAAGPVFTTPGGHPVVTVGLGEDDVSVRVPGDPDQAREMVRDLVSGGDEVDAIKIIHDRGDAEAMTLDPLPTEILGVIVDEAHAHGTHVVVHWGTPADLVEALDAGVDELQHMEPRGVEEGWDAALLERLVDSEVPLAPTLGVVEPVMSPDRMATLRARLMEFVDAGGTPIAASDAPLNGIGFGDAVIREMELFVEAGVSPRQALIAATTTPGSLMPEPGVGVIAPGSPGDLLVVRGDPTADIQAIRDVAMVFRDGARVVG